MSDWKHRIEAEVRELRGLRDEVRLRVHLGKMEAREAFEQAEKRWEHLEAKLALIATESKHAAGEVGDAARLLIEEIRAGYDQVRRHV